MRWMRGEGKEVFGGLGQIKKRQKEGLSKKGKKRKEYLTYYIIKDFIYASKAL